MKHIQKPPVGEFAPYASLYIDAVPDDGRVLQHLADNFHVMQDLVRSLPPEKLTTPHAEGEWTVQEILVHVIDTERVFAYRGLRVARGDSTALPGFEQDDYVPNSRANERTLDAIFAEYDAVRRASITLFESFNDDDFLRIGRASNAPFSVRAAMYQIVGHELHHLNSIKENYQ